MGALGTYCFDGLNFSQASSLYTNSTLSVLAADGFYSQGGIVRQQLNGVLLNAQACSTCQPDVTLFNLCFAVTENDLCCDTSTSVAVYAAGLNVANLSSVVGDLYKDSFLQIKADNGFYSDDAGITCSSPTIAAILATPGGNTCGDNSSGAFSNRFYIISSYSIFIEVNGVLKINNTGVLPTGDADIKQISGETIDSRSVSSSNSTVTSSKTPTTFLVNQSSLADPSGSDIKIILTNETGSQPVIYFDKCN